MSHDIYAATLSLVPTDLPPIALPLIISDLRPAETCKSAGWNHRRFFLIGAGDEDQTRDRMPGKQMLHDLEIGFLDSHFKFEGLPISEPRK